MLKKFAGASGALAAAVFAVYALGGAVADVYTDPTPIAVKSVRFVGPNQCEAVVRLGYDYKDAAAATEAKKIRRGIEAGDQAGAFKVTLDVQCSKVRNFLTNGVNCVKDRGNMPEATDNAAWAALLPADCP